MTEDKLTRMLGWASAGLGAPLLLAAGRSARMIGIEDGSRQRAVVAGVGARELVVAAGLLGRRRPAWLWARVAGDLMDLALLGSALRDRTPESRTLKSRVLKTVGRQGDRGAPGRTVAVAATAAAIAGVDLYAAVTRPRRSAPGDATFSLTAR